MKKSLIFAAVLGMAMVPIAVSAATLASGQQYLLSAQQRIDDNLYVAAGTATVGGQVSGDLFAVGGTLSITGSVGDDAVLMGGTIQLLGPVGGDVRVTGGTISANDIIGGDLVVAGGTIHLLTDAIVEGDLIVAGGQIIIDGTVLGSVQMVGGELAINGMVGGDVSARADKEVILGSSAKIGGTLSYTATKKGASGTHRAVFPGAMFAIMTVVTGMKMLAFLGLGVLLIWIWRRQTLELLSEAAGSFWPSLGRGFAYAILVPIAAIMLLVSFVGSLAGVVMLLIYIIAWIFASVLAGMLLGAWLAKVFAKRPTLRLGWWSGLGGIVLLSVLSLIPFVGWILSKVLALMMFGVLAHMVHRHLESR